MINRCRRKCVVLTPERLSKKTRNCREHIHDVRAWLRAVSADRQAALGAERITTTVIRGTHLGAVHDVPRE